MEKQRKNRYAHTAKQVEEMRRLYSRIGEPLPAEIIIDLYRHLGAALEAGDHIRPRLCRKKQRSQA